MDVHIQAMAWTKAGGGISNFILSGRDRILYQHVFNEFCINST